MRASRWRSVAALALIGVPVGIAGCGSGEDGRDEALASLQLVTEAGSLQSEMGELVADLDSDPSARQRNAAQQRLAAIDREAAELIASAEADATYEVELRPVNRSDVVGVATLVESDGRVAIDGEVEDLGGGGGHRVTVNALPRSLGASVCPPNNAAMGRDGVLSASEAEDFYGRPAISLGQANGGPGQGSLSASRAAGEAPPLTARAVVLSGGRAEKGYESDLPVACGIPTVAVDAAGGPPEEAIASTEIAVALDETRAAGVELAEVIRDPTTRTAARARRSASRRLGAANQRLHAAAAVAEAQLEEEGAASGGESDERQAVDGANATLDASKAVVVGGFRKLRSRVDRERREEQRRKAQRKAAQKAREEAEAAPEPESESLPAPEESVPAPTPEPAPEPEPTPSSPEGPTIVHPG